MSRSSCGSSRPFRNRRRPPRALPPGVVGRVGLAAVVGVVFGTVPRARAQQLDGGESEAVPDRAASKARAELIRFPDGKINVSVFFLDVESVPLALWKRLASSGEVSFLAEGSPQVSELNRIAVVGQVGSSGVRLAADPSDLEPVGVQVTEGGEFRLAWYRRTEPQALEILADAREGQQVLSLRVLVPDFWVSKEWRSLVASLRPMGRTHVQVLSSDP